MRKRIRSFLAQLVKAKNVDGQRPATKKGMSFFDIPYVIDNKLMRTRNNHGIKIVLIGKQKPQY